MDGTSHDLLGEAMPLFDDSGKVRGSIGVFLNIAERKRLEAERLRFEEDMRMIPSWAQDKSIGSRLINARSETVTEKPSFRQAIRYRRCLVLGSGSYERVQEGKAKKPWYIRLKDVSPMVFAGLWKAWKGAEGEVVESCTILTTASHR
jgi:putative SOS response-associated peptidase YedK